MVSDTVLIVAEPFGEKLSAGRVASAIARGLEADGRLRCDLCAIEKDSAEGEPVPDQRMRAARAIVIARERLDNRTLASSLAFALVTRARQGGIPAYAVTGSDNLDPFEARIVDLQVILEARTVHALSSAGKQLAALV